MAYNLFIFNMSKERKEKISFSSETFLCLDEDFYGNFVKDLKTYNSVKVLEDDSFYIKARDFKNICLNFQKILREPIIGRYNFYRDTFLLPRLMLYDSRFFAIVDPKEYESVCLIDVLEARTLFEKLTKSDPEYPVLKNFWRDCFPNNFDCIVNLASAMDFCLPVLDSVAEEETILITKKGL